MNQYLPVTYKIADQQAEFEQIYHLNYETFVEEIPQHEANEKHRLVDRFDSKNTYVIAKRDEEVIGMLTVNGERPFSLDQKLANLDQYLPDDAVPCEIRLLSIKKQHRGGRIFYCLCEKLVAYCLKQGFNLAVISGTLRQTKLYKHLGFEAFGPVVGTEEAPYQPMYLTKKNFERASKLFKRMLKKQEKHKHYNFLPGPVEIADEVSIAWKKAPISHRADKVHEVMDDIQQRLCKLTKANYAEVAVGTGTLANEMVAAQISTLSSPGLILANGEFGERLMDHANRWGLSYHVIHKQWNEPIILKEIEAVLKGNPEIGWLWTVHCETSTGYVHPLQQLKQICKTFAVHLCIDACSTVGVIPVNLQSVYLASTVSGKGLASYPGLAIVFHEEKIVPNEKIPSYLDVGKYQINRSIPFTHSSNGLFALAAALQYSKPEIAEIYPSICQTFEAVGMHVLTGNNYSPGIMTICLEQDIDSRKFGDCLKEKGVHISYESIYLLKRNWIQLAFMGNLKPIDIMQGVSIIVDHYKQFLMKKVQNK